MTFRRLSFVFGLIASVFISALAFGQPQALIISMAAAFARGLAAEVGKEAGREIIESMKNPQGNNTSASFQRPNTSDNPAQCDKVFVPPPREPLYRTIRTPEERRAFEQETDEIYNRQVMLKRQEWERQRLECLAHLPPATSPANGAYQPPSDPNKLTWRMLNSHGQDLALLFNPVDRQPPPPKFNAYPGNNQIFVLPPGQPQRITLNCQQGEKICYGAWRGSIYWGAGYARSHPCHNCCRVCGSAEVSIKLQ